MRRIFVFTCLLIVVLGVHAQVKSEQLTNVKSTSTKAVYLGRTKPIEELTPQNLTDRQKKATYKRNIAVPQNFIGRGDSKSIIPELEHLGPDPLRQSSFKSNGRAVSISPSINMDGLASSFGSPNDPTGEVGINYYLQAINATEIGVYNKYDGTEVVTFPANALWQPLGENSAGDPIILFDHGASRWVITEFTHPSGSGNLLLAISDTSNPLGSYRVYAFSPPNFPDYPKWAIWKDTYMVTTNESPGAGALHQYFFDRAALLAGSSEVLLERVEITGNTNTEAGFYVSTPVHWTGDLEPVDNQPMAVKINDSSWGEVTEDAIEVFTFDVDFVNGTSVTKTTIPTTPFDSYPCDNESGGFACLSQGGSNSGIDAIPEVIMNLPHYRNFGTHEAIVLSFITDVDNGNNLSGIRWVELRRMGGDWELYQEGTFAPDDGLHRFMSSISMDKDGNIGLAYNTTSDSEFVGIKFTGRYAEDELGIMTVTEQHVVSGTGSVGGDRFGDYAQMAIDPIDGRTFWYTSEYASAGGSRTRILAFQLEQNENDMAVISISEPTTSDDLGATETVVATVKNLGVNSVTNFDLTLKFGDAQIETFSYSGDLAGGDTYEHSFGTTIDLSAFGDYEISAIVEELNDNIAGNNTFTAEVTKLASFDVAVGLETSVSSCSSEVVAQVTIKNEGSQTITNLNIEMYVGASLIETIAWEGSLAPGETTSQNIVFTGLSDGSNTVSVILSNPNGELDEITDNNEIVSSINIDTSQDQIKLVLKTDEYPEETSWELLDDVGEVLQTGGPYNQVSSQVIEELCVTPNSCYEFIIYDAFDDGICCDYGQGFYEIQYGTGDIIFSGNGQFGSSEATAFCIGTECNLSVTTEVIDPSSSQNGSIVIDASGSYGYAFSIDGGVTTQESSIFDGLDAGSYDIHVSSQGGNCLFEETVTLDYECNLSFVASGQKDQTGTGTVYVTALGGIDYEYSIDQGVTFQTNNVFEKVPSGNLEVWVRSDGGNCILKQNFEFDFVLGAIVDHQVEIFPNPTDGVFHVKIPGHEYIQGFLNVEIIDINGKSIQSSRFSRYDGVFEGTISLYSYPDGIYFMRLENAETDRLFKIIKN